MSSALVIFENKQIRSVEHKGELWFSVVDIIEVLTNTPNPKRYWSDLKSRAQKESGAEVFAFCEPLKMPTAGGRQNVICANTEGVLRIIMSVPSPKAEPFRLWLAKLGKRDIVETLDPEIGFERLREVYRSRGYPEEWIERRLQSIEVRKQLTDEWKKRGVREGQEYAILTAEIAKRTFGIAPNEHGQLKGLDKHNLRDHMTPIELIFTALSEEATRLIAIQDNAQGFEENHEAAQKGGTAAGNARQNFEKETGLKVLSDQNFLSSTNDAPSVE